MRKVVIERTYDENDVWFKDRIVSSCVADEADALCKAIRERDEAIEDAEALKTAFDVSQKTIKRICGERDNAYVERDEAIGDRNLSQIQREEAVRAERAAQHSFQVSEGIVNRLLGERDKLWGELNEAVKEKNNALTERDQAMTQLGASETECYDIKERWRNALTELNISQVTLGERDKMLAKACAERASAIVRKEEALEQLKVVEAAVNSYRERVVELEQRLEQADRAYGRVECRDRRPCPACGGRDPHCRYKS